jgi:4-amino-4-deoxy-L-arabinose transferase-like glycosyltransferase
MLFVPAKMKQRGWIAETALLVGLVAVAAAFRWPDLWTIPIFTDEGDEIGLALRIVRDGARPLTNDDPYLGPLFNYLLAGLFWLAGPNPWLPRALMLAVGALTALPAYLLARDLAAGTGAGHGRASLAGALAAGLLAVNAGHVLVNSHVAWGNCITPLFTTMAGWLLVRAARPVHPTPGLPLVLAGLAFGLAFQTHPSVAALLPGVVAFVLWRRPRWLMTPWPYLGAGAFLVAQLPTVLFIGQHGLAAWLDAIREKQAMYERDGALGPSEIVQRLGQELHTFGMALGGLLNDRDTPLPPPWHPSIVLAVALAILALGWLARRRQPLIPLVVLSGLLLLPLVNGKYEPLVSNVRYLMPLTVVVLAAISAWAAVKAPPHGRLGAVLVLLVASAVSLASFAGAAHRDGRTNARLLGALAVLEAEYQPGDLVTIDRATYRDWTLTEGRLQRVFDSWLETRGIPHRVVDVEDGGRVRTDLAARGGLAVLARRTVPAVLRGYQAEEIASDAAPGVPPGSGYSIVRLRRAGG